MVVVHLAFNRLKFLTRMEVFSVGLALNFNGKKILGAMSWIPRLRTSTGWLATTTVIGINRSSTKVTNFRKLSTQLFPFRFKLLNVLRHIGPLLNVIIHSG